MTTKNFKYHVIWIDDKCKEYGDFIENAATEGIQIEGYEYGKDGIEALKKDINAWDGVILDVKCLYDKDDLDIEDNFYTLREEIQNLKAKERPELPLFTYTAQPDILSNDTFIKSLNHSPFYQKGEMDEILIHDIKAAADKLPTKKLEIKYLNDIPFRELYSELIDIINQYVEKNNVETKEYESLVKIRLVLNWIMRFCNDVGILPVMHDGENLNICSRFLGKKEMLKYVPLHVQRSLHSCVMISNNGCHREDVFRLVKDGKAPFLIRSTVFELLNILVWCASLSKDQKQIELLKEEISRIPIEESIEGKVLKDSFGNYHCNDCLITYSQVMKYDILENDLVLIEKVAQNHKKSDRNPYNSMAKKIEKL